MKKELKKPQSWLSVGIDIGADFSYMAIARPDGTFIGKPFRIIHEDPKSRELAVRRIKEAQELYHLESRCFPESTGIYHIPLLRYLKDRGFDCTVLNPLITKGNTSVSVRKIHNDKFDSQKIATLGLNRNLKNSIIPDDLIVGLRDLVRDYFYAVDRQTADTIKLTAHLKVLFPGYMKVFSKVTVKTSLAVLENWPVPQSILNAPEEEVLCLIRHVSRQGEKVAGEKYAALRMAAEAALEFGRMLPSDACRTRTYISSLRAQGEIVRNIMQGIRELTGAPGSETISRHIELLQTIPGIGFLSAAVLTAEIGCFETFSNARQLAAYFGLDPCVKQSGKFQADHQRMSKRGSALARRILYLAAVQNIRRNADGIPVNPAVYAFYEKKCKSKPKLVALGAVAHKLCKIIFAVLRDSSGFVHRTAEAHQALIEGGKSA